MRTIVAIDVAAPAELVFRLARDIERWPRLLPHYLRVRRLSGAAGQPLTLQMIAVRPLFGLGGFGLPVVWRARTWAEPDRLQLRFEHLGGVTAGMDVTWRIQTTATGCHVSIEHLFRRRMPIPAAGDWLADRLGDEALPALVDRFFTRPIAERTLATFKALAEALAEEPVEAIDTGAASDRAAATYPVP